jgi:hypothetical protein
MSLVVAISSTRNDSFVSKKTGLKKGTCKLSEQKMEALIF